MKEYIERAAVHDLVKSLPEYHMFNYDRTESRRGISPDDVDFGVDKIPAADVVEVRHGRWIITEYEFFTCSVCGESYYNGAESTAQAESYLNSGHTYKYCPNCGACMDKEDEHEAG